MSKKKNAQKAATVAERLAVGHDIVYLIRCALTGETADLSRLGSSAAAIYQTATARNVAALCTYALDGAVNPSSTAYQAFDKVRNHNVSRIARFDVERQCLYEFLEERGIHYMSLKGIVLRSYYPQPAMREMADNDIWYDAAHRDEVVQWFIDRGYLSDDLFADIHHEFTKAPIFNFELHYTLFSKQETPAWHAYYEEKLAAMQAEAGETCELTFSDEDFYIYNLMHAYKHHTGDGTGIRTLVDNHVMTRQFAGHFDRAYVDRELARLGILDFERGIAVIAEKIFGEGGELTEEEQDLFDTILLCGTFGTYETKIKNGLASFCRDSDRLTFGARLKYLWSRVFTSPRLMKRKYHAKYAWMLPFCYVYRFVIVVFPNFKRTLMELRMVFRSKLD